MQAHRALRAAACLALLLACGCDSPQALDVGGALAGYELAAARRPVAAPEARSDAVEDLPRWLELGAALAQAGPPATAPAGEAYVPWPQRRGPAYPHDRLRSFGRDAKEFLPALWEDTRATFTSPLAWVGFGAAGAAGIVLSASEADTKVENHYSRTGSKFPHWLDELGETGGNPGVHFALAGVMYAAGLAGDDVRTYETSKTLLNALAINGLVTVALKGIVRTHSPNGDPYGWPSGHTSSSFCLATVMYHAYGPAVGLPLFAFAGFVGYERIDARNHDFSDVISGALIGMAIGHVVAKNHEARIAGFDVVPYADPARGAVGLALARQW